ncbi:MAG: tetratricopeptide repeat protein [Tannerella sp.]|nr:tetratricopeptide repeat protein [Tannerella sp.]
MLNIERKIGVVLTAFLLCTGSVAAQKAERKNVREGNKQYKKEKYTEAEIAYRKGIEVNPRSTESIYDLGNALYKQEKYPEASEQYQLIAGQGERLLREDPNNAARLAQVFHNLGNIGMKSREYQKSVEAYKQSLRLNPTDEETRYNLALAQKLLQDQQDQNQEQNQDQEQEQNQDQEQQDQQDQNQDQQQDQNQEQQQDRNRQEQQEQEQKTREQQQQNEQMSRDNAQQMLDAFLQDEKDTQEKVKKAQMQQQQSRKQEKQW